MSSKIKIKMGAIEVEYEGSEEFLEKKLLGFLTNVSELYKSSGFLPRVEEAEVPHEKEVPKVSPPKAKIEWSTGTIASKLLCENGPDLIIAACAHFAFVAGQKSFRRKDILAQMKTATGKYKKSYCNNLSSYIQRLVNKDKLNELQKGTFALNEATNTELKEKLGIK